MDTPSQKLLIVEDDPLMARMYGKTFEFEGYEILFATNGKEGVDMAAQHTPAIILLDAMMPIMNGFEALRLLKADPSTAAIPVIMLTNLSGSSDADNALQLGAVRYLVKSDYEPEQLVAIVKEVLAA